MPCTLTKRPAILAYLIFISLGDSQFPVELTCLCRSGPSVIKGVCFLQGDVCNSSNGCYFQREIRPSGVIEEIYDCVPNSGVTIIDLFCAQRKSNIFTTCCNDRNLCNQNLTLPPFPFEMETATSFSPVPTVMPGKI